MSEKITFDKKNYRKHSDTNKKKIKKSLQECGAGRSVLVDKDGCLIAGNGVYEQAEKLGIKTRIVETDGSELVVVKRTDLATDDEKRKLLALADNATSDKVEWDFDTIGEDFEMEDLSEWDVEFNVDIEAEAEAEASNTNEEDEMLRKKIDFERRMSAGEDMMEDDEYLEFVEKFEAKKTTDDCYTPPVIYEAVADWVEKKYNVNKAKFVRPFVPNGDYKSEKYKADCVVCDNPPFSILSEIIEFYQEREIKFFLFCPTLTSLRAAYMKGCTLLNASVKVTYENGAVVATSFITNLEDSSIVMRTEPTLYSIVLNADNENKKQTTRELPKYEYPKHVVTAAMFNSFARCGVDVSIARDESFFISGLDSQKEFKKGIFGGGLLVSDRMVEERVHAEQRKVKFEIDGGDKERRIYTFQLSDREKKIILTLNKQHGEKQ